ncbi:hypothetical protein [Salegentibacter salegens]|uniref:hypothetical protein n=1 Tax=Salegentibacter salegens TaxID=143223 RepID=UPI00147464C5|nr:hypothetical protein [Salegentibacter salegens]
MKGIDFNVEYNCLFLNMFYESIEFNQRNRMEKLYEVNTPGQEFNAFKEPLRLIFSVSRRSGRKGFFKVTRADFSLK